MYRRYPMLLWESQAVPLVSDKGKPNLENPIFPGPEKGRCKAWTRSRMTDNFSSGIGFLTAFLLYLYGKKGRFVCAGSLQQMN